MKWLKQVGIGFDRFLNAVLRGSADEMLSSRAHRMREKRHKYWGWTADAIDFAFRLLRGQENHCLEAWRYESKRFASWVTHDTAGDPLTEIGIDV